MQSSEQSPFASVVGLGPLQSQHPLKTSGRWFNIGCGVLGLLAAPALGGFALWDLWDTYSRYGEARLDNEIGTVLVIGGLGLAALVVGGLMLYSAWQNWGSAAALYENGLAHVSRKGLQQVRWDDVAAVWQAVTKHYRNGIYTGTTHVYTVQTKAGAKIVVDDKFDKVEDLGNAIQRAVTRTLYRRYAEALQAGQRLTFGPLALDKQGLYAGQKSLTWTEIKAVKLERGVISVKKEGGWFNWTSATVPQIPNFFIFYDLLSRLTKVE